MCLANNIRKFRISSGLTQSQLAYRLSVSKNTVSSWETYVFSPSLIDCMKLCSVFNCKIDDLFPDFYNDHLVSIL